MKYLLLAGREGTKWEHILPLAVAVDEVNAKSVFSDRAKPWILWWLIDLSKMPKNYNTWEDLGKMFNDLSSLYGEKFIDSNYNFSPFVGFYDMVAKDRSWGLLKDWSEI